jgi:hypothetical protein
VTSSTSSGQPALARRLLDAFRRGVDAPLDDFGAWALEAFAYQFERNAPYRRFCERRGAVPGRVRRWEEIPAVPTAAFKEVPLLCGRPEDAEAVFRTSGTSRGAARRGTHYVLDLELYRASALPNFEAHLLPDGARPRMLLLAPAAAQAPDSSLGRMFDWVSAAFGAPGSEGFVDERGLDVDRLVDAVRRADADGVPVCFLGTAFAYVHLFDALAARGLRLRCPPGSRALETGGLKGRAREVTREELYAGFAERLGLPQVAVVAEYGMTEMCSQFYEPVWREHVRTGAAGPRRFRPPPWVRTLVVDADTLEPVPAGQVGLLRHLDLANLHSVCAVQTDDLGVAVADGFRLLGRATGAEARGCSLAFDEWMAATR